MPGTGSNPGERLVKGLLDLVVMGFLKYSSSLGAYDLIGLIHSRFQVMVSPGVIYPVLITLEKDGFLRPRWKERKKVYELTDGGEEYMVKQISSYSDMDRKVSNLLVKKESDSRSELLLKVQ